MKKSLVVVAIIVLLLSLNNVEAMRYTPPPIKKQLQVPLDIRLIFPPTLNYSLTVIPVRLPEPGRMIEYESPTMLRFWTDDADNAFTLIFTLSYGDRFFNESLVFVISQAGFPPSEEPILLQGYYSFIEIKMEIVTVSKPEYPSIEEIWEYGYQNRLKPFFYNITNVLQTSINGQYAIIAFETFQSILLFAIFLWSWRRRGI